MKNIDYYLCEEHTATGALPVEWLSRQKEWKVSIRDTHNVSSNRITYTCEALGCQAKSEFHVYAAATEIKPVSVMESFFGPSFYELEMAKEKALAETELAKAKAEAQLADAEAKLARAQAARPTYYRPKTAAELKAEQDAALVMGAGMGIGLVGLGMVKGGQAIHRKVTGKSKKAWYQR